MMRLSAMTLAALAAASPAFGQDWQTLPGTENGVLAAAAQWSSGVAIVARCSNGDFDVLLPLAAPVEGTEASVTYTFDDAETPSEQTWAISDGGEAVFASMPARFVRQLRGSERLVLTVDDGSPPRQRYELDIDGETSPLVDVLEACDKPLVDPRDAMTVKAGAVRWERPPRPQYPAKALRERVAEGRATLSCLATAQGRLELCEIEGESPYGYDFGQAAIRAVSAARVQVDAAEDGSEPKALITFTVRFRLS